MADAIQVLKGVPTDIKVRFIRQGVAVAFQAAPLWQIMNEDDEVIVSGTATAGVGAGEWVASFTIPSDYEPLDGQQDEDLLLEVFGTDTARRERSTEREIRMLNYADDFIPEGLIWFKGQPFKDVIASDGPISSLTAQIQNAAGEIIHVPSLTPGTARHVRNASDVPDRFDVGRAPSLSYQTEVSAAAFDLPFSSVPYLIYYSFTANGQPETVVHQLYWTNNRVITLINRLKNYLDKARLTEIDPTMQWWDGEVVASTYEGLQYINGFPPEMTSWSQLDLPMSLETYWMYASAFHLLNTRYLAEGMTKFNFTGLNSTLDVDRTEALQYKMDEIKSFLDRLETAKKSAVKNNGPGTTDPTTGVQSGTKSIALLGLTSNPTNNRLAYRNYNRRRRFAPW